MNKYSIFRIDTSFFAVVELLLLKPTLNPIGEMQLEGDLRVLRTFSNEWEALAFIKKLQNQSHEEKE